MPLFFLIGDDVISKHDAFLKFLAKHNVSFDYASISYEELKNDANAAATLETFFLTQDLFKSKKILLVKRFEDFDRHIQDRVIPLAHKTSADNYVFFELNMPARECRRFLEDRALEGVKVSEYEIPKVGKNSDFIGWTIKRFGALQKKCPPSTASLITERFQDYHSIANALHKIALNAGNRGDIRPEDVEALAGRTIDSDIVDLVKALFLKDLGKAFYALAGIKDYEQQEVFVLIVGRLASEFKKSYGGKSFYRTRFSRAEIPQALRSLMDTDYAVKRGMLKPGRALEMFLAHTCRKNHPSSLTTLTPK